MNLQLAILKTLNNAGKHLLVRETTLVSELRILDREESLAQIRDGLRTLEERGQIVGANHEDHGTRWKITDEGFVRLAEANL